jgi:hypothetical protein
MKNIYFYFKHWKGSYIAIIIFFAIGCSVPETDFIKPIPVALEASDIQSTSFVANWKPVLGSSVYIVDVSIDPLFSSYVTGYQSREIEGNALEVTGLAAEVTYHYRVRGQKEHTFSDNSNVIAVTTAALNSPVANPPTATQVFNFTANWTAIEEAASYLIEVATDPDFNTILPGYNALEVVGLSLEVKGLDYTKSYYYRVKSKRLEKTSGYSNIIAVKPCVSEQCKLSKITYSSDFIITFLYENAGRLSTIDIMYYGDQYDYNVGYADNGLADTVSLFINEEMYEKHALTYNSNGNLASVYVYDYDDVQVAVKDYIYNELQQIVGFRNYKNESRTSLNVYQDYEVDEAGNVLKILDKNGTQKGEFRYDEHFNPKMLIQEALRPFIWDFFSGFDLSPYSRINNPIYAKGNFQADYDEEEVFIYDLNECDVALARKGFYSLTYEFTGCDF